MYVKYVRKYVDLNVDKLKKNLETSNRLLFFYRSIFDQVEPEQ